MAQKWAVFTLLKAKKTSQTKPYKTTLHTNVLPSHCFNLKPCLSVRKRSEFLIGPVEALYCVSPCMVVSVRGTVGKSG